MRAINKVIRRLQKRIDKDALNVSYVKRCLSGDTRSVPAHAIYIMGQGLLQHAAKKWPMKDLEWLLDRGADVNAVHPDQQSPLSWALKREEPDVSEVAQLLIDRGARLDQSGWNPGPPLFWLGLSHQLSESLIKQLISNDVDVQYQDHQGYTGLHLATLYQRTDIMMELIQRGAMIDAKDRQSGRTPLHCGCEVYCLEGVKMLIDHGANPDEKTSGGQDALQMAEAMEVFSAQGRDVVDFLKAIRLARQEKLELEQVTQASPLHTSSSQFKVPSRL